MGRPVPVNNTSFVCFLMSCTTSVCRRADVVCILFIQHTCDWLVGRRDARSSLPYHHLRCITTPLCHTSAQTEFSRVPVLQGGISGLTYCFAMFRPSDQLRANVQGFTPLQIPARWSRRAGNSTCSPGPRALWGRGTCASLL